MDTRKKERLNAAGWQTGDYAEFLKLTPEERAAVEARIEHQRLKNAVVEAAIEFIDDDSAENKESLYIARAALRDFQFESKEG